MIYLDNCSTTKMRPEVLEKMYSSLEEDFGNPSSLHRLGFKSEKEIKKSRQIVADYLKVDEREVYFTSGGTESNNIAIQGLVNSLGKRRKHIITSKIEHASVINTMKNLEKKGFRVTYLDVDKQGRLALDQLEESLDEDTILCSIMHVNNEIGSIQDIKSIKEIIKLKNPKALLHVDGVQSFGKIDFSLRDMEVDVFSFSSHKIHGPKGVGGLYVRRDLKLSSIVFGGNQENGMRSGTENVSGIIAFGKAVEIMAKNKEKESQYVGELKKYSMGLIEKNIGDIRFNSSLEKSFSPYILNISFRNTRGEVLLHFLEQKDIYISTSSACSSSGTEKSDVLRAIALNDSEIEGAVRICFSYENKREDIEVFVDELEKAVKEIRKIIMR